MSLGTKAREMNSWMKMVRLNWGMSMCQLSPGRWRDRIRHVQIVIVCRNEPQIFWLFEMVGGANGNKGTEVEGGIVAWRGGGGCILKTWGFWLKWYVVQEEIKSLTLVSRFLCPIGCANEIPGGNQGVNRNQGEVRWCSHHRTLYYNTWHFGTFS